MFTCANACWLFLTAVQCVKGIIIQTVLCTFSASNLMHSCVYVPVCSNYAPLQSKDLLSNKCWESYSAEVNIVSKWGTSAC